MHWCIVRMATVQAVLQLTEQRWLRKSTAVCFHWQYVWWETQSPFFTLQGSASVPVCCLTNTPWSLFSTRTCRLKFESDLMLLLSAEAQLVLSVFVLICLRVGFGFPLYPVTFIWVLLVWSKAISLSAYWWWRPIGGNYSPFYITITVIICVGWHSSRNSWDE